VSEVGPAKEMRGLPGLVVLDAEDAVGEVIVRVESTQHGRSPSWLPGQRTRTGIEVTSGLLYVAGRRWTSGGDLSVGAPAAPGRDHRGRRLCPWPEDEAKDLLRRGRGRGAAAEACRGDRRDDVVPAGLARRDPARDDTAAEEATPHRAPRHTATDP